jgi:hypothetical protein
MELPPVAARTEVYVDPNPVSGEAAICVLHRMHVGEGALVAIWYSPEDFRGLVAQAQDVLQELEQIVGSVAAGPEQHTRARLHGDGQRIAMGGGTDVALAAADICLQRGPLPSASSTRSGPP